MYEKAQWFTVSGSTKLEIKFNPFKGKDGKPLPNGNGQFVVSDHSNPDKNLEGTIKSSMWMPNHQNKQWMPSKITKLC